MQMSTGSPAALLASFFSSSKVKPGLVLITGQRGSGKTSWCLKLVKQAQDHGLKPIGLVSPAVFEGDKKVGIDLMDLSSAQQRRLAYLKGDANGDLKTTEWQMVFSTLDWGNSILERIDSCDLFILDELGPLEFEHGVGLVAGFGIINSRKSGPCFVVVRPSMLIKARERWPWALCFDLSQEIER